MLDTLPTGRPLNEAELENLKDASQEFTNVAEREGCISFVMSMEDIETIGFHFAVLEGEWVESVIAETPDEAHEDTVEKHKDEIRPLMKEYHRIDERKGRTYPYMTA